MTHTHPNLGLTGAIPAGENGWDTLMNDNLLKLSIIPQLAVKSMVAALPGSPTNGDIHILTATADVNKIAARDNGAWVYFTPVTGWTAYVIDVLEWRVWSGTAWTVMQKGGALLSGSKTHDFGSIADGARESTTVTVTGAALGDFFEGVSLGVDQAGVMIWGYVSAADTVTVTLHNETGAAVDLASTPLRVRVRKRV